MSTFRIILVAGALVSAAAAAAQAQTASAPSSQPVLDMSQAAMMPPVMDNGIYAHAVLDQFEGRVGGPNPAFRWDGQAWIGTDYDKLWLKSEGFVQGHGRVEDGQHELLYDRSISTYFDLQAGLRSDIDSRTTRNWAAFGVQGLAPLFFDLEATGYVSDQGHLAARVVASYDLLLTQRLILQPEAELNFYSKADPGRSVGSGLSDIDAGIRLRYEISRKFAPYLGVAYGGKFGQSADFARQQGETAQGVRFVFGIRSWF
jgi:copper resistance protein B